MQNIVDHQTDKSQAVFCQAIESLEDKQFATRATEMINDLQSHEKTASEQVYADPYFSRFPIGTMEDTILSKLYFDHQREKLAEHQESTIGAKLDTYLNLYEVPEAFFTCKQEKVASDTGIEARYLLPSLNLCKVASEDDLNKAADLFSREYDKLNVSQRVEFSLNYIKMASELDSTEYPSAIAKYAGALDTDMQSLQALLEIRAAAATRKGMSGEQYTKLAFDLRNVEEAPSREELTKLAGVIHQMDEQYGFTTPEYDHRLPCAYSSVFNKEAVDEDITGDPGLSKAQIVAQYGEDALEAVEDEDGNIDEYKLKTFTGIHGNA